MDQYMIAMMNISSSKAIKLWDKLNRQIETLSMIIKLEEEVFIRHREIRCTKLGDGKWSPGERKKIRRELSRGLTNYILEDEEEKLLRVIFARDYSYTAEADLAKLLSFCRRLPDSDEWLPKEKARSIKRFRQISEEIEACLHQNGYVNLDGLLAFRLEEYRNDLKETVDYAVDEYLLDKQYQEFISLLKYFVFIQKSKVSSVHLLHKGDSNFVLLNEKLEPMHPSVAGGEITMETLEKELNFEDIIVSTLITVAPARIYIHSHTPELPVIKTIRQIFEDRACLCDCKMCNLLDSERAQDHILT
ncbi:MAG: putative sporulation protein YtxC [Gorillibacterium sp.]|nr:putative sporulation protein YtxC [Gorillibacterium sp.]